MALLAGAMRAVRQDSGSLKHQCARTSRRTARHLRNLRASELAGKSPHGQDLLGVMDLRLRSEVEHLYIREIVDNDDYKIIFLQSDQQAQLSGRLRNFQAVETVDVVEPGSELMGVSQAAIDSSAPHDHDWHQFSIVYDTSHLCRAPVMMKFDTLSEWMHMRIWHYQRTLRSSFLFFCFPLSRCFLFFFSVEQGLDHNSQQGRCCHAGHPDWEK